MAEKFTSRNNISLSIKPLVIGAGQAGGKICNEFSRISNDYLTYAINSCEADLKSLNSVNKRFKLNNGDGCGSDPNVCRDLLRDKYNQENIVNDILSILKGKDYNTIIIAAGLGGGTGTGLITTMIKVVNSLKCKKQINDNIPIGAIITVPHEKEAVVKQANSEKELNTLVSLTNQKLLNYVFVINNDYSINIAKSLDSFSEWQLISNKMFVEKFHEFNTGVMMQPIESSDVFDRKDCFNILKDASGFIFLRKAVFNIENFESKEGIDRGLNDHERCEQAYMYDESNCLHHGFLVVKPKKKVELLWFNEYIEERYKNLITNPGAVIEWESKSRILVYTIEKYKEIPGEIRNGIGKVNEKLKRINEKKKSIASEDINIEDPFDDVNENELESILGDPFPDNQTNDESDFDFDSNKAVDNIIKCNF
jgi:hypothetical protein